MSYAGVLFVFFFLKLRRPPRSTLFPYTPLFRSLRLVNGAGAEVAAQFSVLGTWPDGSAKWILVDFQGDVEAGGEAVYSLQAGAAQAVEECVEIIDGEERVEVCTGPLRFGVGNKSFALFDGVEPGERTGGEFAPETEVAPRGGGDAGARRSGDHFFRFIGSKASVFAFYGKEGEPLIEVNTSSGTGFEEGLGTW